MATYVGFYFFGNKQKPKGFIGDDGSWFGKGKMIKYTFDAQDDLEAQVLFYQNKKLWLNYSA